jgi:flagellar protein FliJ
MKRFRFPLHPVVVLRGHRELRAREAFAAAVQAFAKSEADLAEARQRVAQFEAAVFAARRERFSAAKEGTSLAAYRRECAAEAQSERAMTAARNLMQQRRREYIEAHRKLEVVERFEAKAKAAHRFATNREEQAEFDDLSGARARRQSLLSL